MSLLQNHNLYFFLIPPQQSPLSLSLFSIDLQLVGSVFTFSITIGNCLVREQNNFYFICASKAKNLSMFGCFDVIVVLALMNMRLVCLETICYNLKSIKGGAAMEYSFITRFVDFRHFLNKQLKISLFQN